MCEKAMPGRHVHDATPPDDSSDPARDFPRFEEFLPGQASGSTNHPADAVQQGVVRKPAEVVLGEAALGSVGEHSLTVHSRPFP